MRTIPRRALTIMIRIEERQHIEQRIRPPPLHRPRIITTIEPDRRLDRLLQMLPHHRIQHERPHHHPVLTHTPPQRPLRRHRRLIIIHQRLRPLLPLTTHQRRRPHVQQPHRFHHTGLMLREQPLGLRAHHPTQQLHLPQRQPGLPRLTRRHRHRLELLQEPTQPQHRLGITTQHPTPIHQPRLHRQRTIQRPLLPSLQPRRPTSQHHPPQLGLTHPLHQPPKRLDRPVHTHGLYRRSIHQINTKPNEIKGS